MAGKSTTTGDIVKLKVTLTGIRPPVWRRLLLPAGMTLGDLHDAIQSSMGWENAHLHDFDVDGRRYGDPGTTDDVISEERLTLAAIHRTGIERFKYTYDFGDDWVHLITIEGTIPTVAGQRYPACIAGKRSCPPEDCGGPYGYAHFLWWRPSAIAPDETRITSRPSRLSAATSAQSEVSHSRRNAPVSASTSKAEPILMTMQRAPCRRSLIVVDYLQQENTRGCCRMSTTIRQCPRTHA
jgi:hypothetical protein